MAEPPWSTMSVETWRTIAEFPDYVISDRGNIFNTRLDMLIKTSLTNHGHVKVALTDREGIRRTLSVGLLVAETFLQPPHYLCDHVMVLDGNITNVDVSNLAWRPRGFAWRYTRQLKISQPEKYTAFRVKNIITGIEYNSIAQAGMIEGLLYDDIYRSVYEQIEVYPTGSVFEAIGSNS